MIGTFSWHSSGCPTTLCFQVIHNMQYTGYLAPPTPGGLSQERRRRELHTLSLLRGRDSGSHPSVVSYLIFFLGKYDYPDWMAEKWSVPRTLAGELVPTQSRPSPCIMHSVHLGRHCVAGEGLQPEVPAPPGPGHPSWPQSLQPSRGLL